MLNDPLGKQSFIKEASEVCSKVKFLQWFDFLFVFIDEKLRKKTKDWVRVRFEEGKPQKWDFYKITKNFIFFLFSGPNKENDENPDFEKILAFLKEFMDLGLEKFLKEQAKIKKTIATIEQKSYLRSDHALLNIVLDSVNTYELIENELR